jgi:hypothetical protein
MYFAADACPSIGKLKETTLETSSALFNVACCNSSLGCRRSVDQCSEWKNEKLSYSAAAQACQELGPEYRLCTQDELLGDNCCNKGCGSNSIKVWTSGYQTGKKFIMYCIQGTISIWVTY